jgi:putative flippase GtrA
MSIPGSITEATMGYFCAFLIGMFEFSIQWAQYKILFKFSDGKDTVAQVVKFSTVLLIGVGLLSAIQICNYFPGTDRGISAIGAMALGCVGGWIFKKQYKAQRRDDNE